MIEATPGTQELLNSARMDARNGVVQGFTGFPAALSHTPSVELEPQKLVSRLIEVNYLSI